MPRAKNAALLVDTQGMGRQEKQEQPNAKTQRRNEKPRHKLRYALSPEAVANAGVRPWLSCVFVGVLLLLMAPAQMGGPSDGMLNQEILNY